MGTGGVEMGVIILWKPVFRKFDIFLVGICQEQIFI